MSVKSTQKGTLVPLVDPVTTPDSRDRVVEAYYGKMGLSLMRDTRRRIHWVCKRTAGKKVLDVGCSQGVVSLLLAREGTQVTGIDASPKSIDEALRLASGQPSHVRERLRFIHADFLSHDFGEEKYATVVMAEVLEHLIQPGRFVQTAWGLLEERGRIVVTVPFGINDFIDHKTTYYLNEPLALVSRFFDVSEIELVGPWLALAGSRKSEPDDGCSSIPIAVLERLEKAFFGMESRLRDEVSSKTERSERLADEQRGLRSEIATLRQTHKDADVARRDLESKIQQVDTELTRSRELLHSERNKHSEQLLHFEQEAKGRAEALLLAEKAAARAEGQLVEMRERIGALQQQLNSDAGHIAELHAQITKADAAVVKTLQERAEAVAGWHRRETDLERQVAEASVFRAALEGAAEGLHRDLEAAVSARRELERRLTALEAEAGRLRGEAEAAAGVRRELERQLGDLGKALEAERSRRSDTETLCTQARERATQLEAELGRKAAECAAIERASGHFDKNPIAPRLNCAQAEAEPKSKRLEQKNKEKPTAQTELQRANSELKRWRSRSEALEEELEAVIDALKLEIRRQKQTAQRPTDQHQTLSFLLGHMLIGSTKSGSDFVRLPRNLWGWRKEVLRRRAARQSPPNQALAEANSDSGSSTDALVSRQVARANRSGSLDRAPRQCGPQLRLGAGRRVELTTLGCDVRVVGLREGELRLSGRIYAVRGERPRTALIRFEIDGEVLDHSLARRTGVPYSERLGLYQYLPTDRGAADWAIVFRVPPAASEISLSFLSWFSDFPISIGAEVLCQQGMPGATPLLSPQPMMRGEGAHREQESWTEESDERQQDAGEVSKGRAATTISTPSQPPTTPKETGILGWPTRRQPQAGSRKKPRVLAVVDEFTQACLSPDCDLIQPRPDNWEALMDRDAPELVFIESAWKGNGGSWQYRVGQYGYCPGPELDELVKEAKRRHVPVVFWNKEDPVHHQRFKRAALLADLVLTTDEQMVPAYERELGPGRAHVLPFAAQPSLHSPAALDGRLRKSCFAGSWYGNRHELRADSMRWLLAAARESGLDIFDRNFGQNINQFPEELRPHVLGGLEYTALCRKYREYRVFLNVNSVSTSPSMFSRRVYELLACGTPVLSTHATGIELQLGKGTVRFVNNSREVTLELERLFNDNDAWRNQSLRGVRAVFSKHTYAHRLARICTLVGLDQYAAAAPKVLMVASVSRHHDIEALAEFRQQQSWQGFRIVALSANADWRKTLEASDIRAFEGAAELAAHVARERGAIEYDLVGYLHGGASYGPDYLQDLINAASFAPEHQGWAKSLDGDRYAMGDDYNSCGCLIRGHQALSARFDPSRVGQLDIFCADATGFSPQGRHI